MLDFFNGFPKSGSRPDEKAGLAVAPYLAHAVVDDVGNGEHQQAAGDTHRTKGYLLCSQEVCRYQANGEEDAEQKEQHTHF